MPSNSIIMMNGGSKRYEKNTTFTKRPGLPQIASYLIFTLETVLFYSVVLPRLEGTPQTIFGVLYSLTLLFLVISTLTSSLCDPSDRIMIQYRNTSREEFESYRKTCNIRLLFCDYCRSFVRDRSRHCRACDRCVEDFDHHCMWINNCVGGLNYRSFLLMILSAFSNLLLYVLALLVLTLQNKPNNFLPAFIAAWLSGGINSIFVLLLINLIILHLYLIHKGISTYEFIMAQREQQRKQKQQEEEEEQKNRELPRTDSQKLAIKNDAANSSAREQEINDHVEMKHEDTSDHVIRIRSQEKRQEQRSSVSSQQRHHDSEEKQRHPLVKSVIFGQNDLTQKSENLENVPPGREILPENEGDSEGESSIELSQLFTRNKSLKFIIGKNEFYRPHRTSRDQARDIKSKSMFARQ